MLYRIYFFLLLQSAFLLITPKLSAIQTDQYEDQTVYKNWYDVQIKTQFSESNTNSSVYDRLSENFYSLYKLTNHDIYLNYALFEAGGNKRQEIISQLSSEEKSNLKEIIDLRSGEIPTDIYSIRPFSPKDLYLFLMVAIPDTLKAEASALLSHWNETLSENYFEKNPLEAALKAQALVYGYNDLRDYQEAYQAGKYLIKFNSLPNSLFTFNLYSRLAYTARNTGYYSDALKVYENILLPLAKELEFQDRLLTTKMDYALTLFRIGNVQEALSQFENVYDQGVENLASRYRPVLFNNLAVSYLNSGQFDRYVQFQLEAFDIAQQEENFDQQLSILRNLFVFYRRQNETSLALNYLNQALEISQQYNLPDETAGVQLSLGVYKRETEHLPNEALDHFYEALELSQQSESYQREFNSYIELGETYHALENPSESENYFQQAVEISSSREDQRNHTMAIVRYSNMLLDNDLYEEAENLMKEIDINDLDQIPFDLEVLGKNVNIRLDEHKGELINALKLSTDIIEDIFGWLEESTDMQTGHMRMDEEFSETFQLHTDLLRQQGNYHEAITITGRLRNLSRTGFYNNPLLKSQLLSEEELIKDYNLSNKIEDLRSRFANATDEQKVYLGNQLADANAERNNLLNQAFPNYTASDYSEILPEAMDQLSSDQMVIYFSIFEDQIFQYFITSGGLDMKAYPADKENLDLLDKAVASFGHASTNLNLLHKVYETYFADNIPEGIEHIYMIPDGVFYRIPIEILPVLPVNSPNSYGSSTYLIEKYSVSYLNTLSDLVTTHPAVDYNYDLAAFGVSNFSAAGHPELPDLPFSPREVTESAEQLDRLSNNQFFINDNSTESNFRSIAGNAKIIHLATHSKVDDENPLFSSLYMYSGTVEHEGDSLETENDGIVHAYELFDLNLNADLIFLSSCESGSGGYLKGAGVLGFSRAFAYAGAQSLSINLWPIRDQTASEISSEFYASINEGKDKAEALRDARLHYLNNSNSDPYLWGAYIMYGNIDPAVNNYTFLIQILLSGFLIAGLCFIAIFAYQKKALPGI